MHPRCNLTCPTLQPHVPPDVRFYPAYYCVCALVCAGLMLATCFHEGPGTGWLRLLVAFGLLELPLQTLIVALGRQRSRALGRFLLPLPTNLEYVVERFNGLLMEILGVAILVPNAVYPGAYDYPSRAAAGTVCAAVLVLSLKVRPPVRPPSRLHPPSSAPLGCRPLATGTNLAKLLWTGGVYMHSMYTRGGGWHPRPVG